MDKVQLGDLIDTVKGFAFKSSWYTAAGVPVIRVKDFTDDSISPVDNVYIDESVASEFGKYVLEEGDVIIQTVGSWESNPNSIVGKVVRVPRELVGGLLNQNAVRIDVNANITKSFLYYRLKDESFKRYIINTAQGAANQASITLESIRSYSFNLPPLEIQGRIASILNAYDDLIDNNRRRIKLLEDAARCEYKMLMEEETETVKLIELYDTSSGGTPSKAQPEYYGGTIPFYKTKELQDSVLIGSEEHITETAVEKSSAKLFPTGTVLLAMYGATIGRLGILTHDATTNQACCAITPKYEEYSNIFIYQFLLENREYVLSFRMGAAQENISQTIIKDFDVPKFSTERMNEYNLKVSNYFALIENLTRQNKQLRHARDILLPKLMSGEIDVEGDISTSTIIEMPTNETMAAEDGVVYTKSPKAGIVSS